MTDDVIKIPAKIENALNRGPHPGEYRGMDYTDANHLAYELVEAAHVLSCWHHLPEHLTQLRAIMDVHTGAGTMNLPGPKNEDPPGTGPQPEPLPTRIACEKCFRWIDTLGRDPCPDPRCPYTAEEAA